MSLTQMATTEHSDLEKFLTKVAETFEKLKVSEKWHYMHLAFTTSLCL